MIPTVIFFDLDDTLIYEETTNSSVIVNVIRRLLAAASDVPDARLFNTVHAAARSLWQESPSG